MLSNVYVLLRNGPKKCGMGLRRECFASIREVNGINVNFPLLYLFFVDITSNHQSFCSVFVMLPLSEMQFLQIAVVPGWTMTQCTVLSSPPRPQSVSCHLRLPREATWSWFWDFFTFGSETHLFRRQVYSYQFSSYSTSWRLCTPEIIGNIGKYGI